MSAISPEVTGQIKDPIYGYIDYVKGLEDAIIDSWPLQRLRYIYQLQSAHFIYPGATHTRFDHSIGVMHASYKYITYLAKSSRADLVPNDIATEISVKYREIVFATRILGLLHDIGHGPFSHAFDKYVFKTRNFLPYRVGNHEVFGYIIYKYYLRSLIEGVLKERARVDGFDVEYTLSILDEVMKPPSGMYDFTELTSKGLLKRDDFYDPSKSHGVENIARLVVRDYVYTSDIMDYLKRDSYFTGVPIGDINDEWILRNSYIVQVDGKILPGITSKALDEIARLFDARKIMYKSVYLHPANLAFVEMLGRLLNCVKSKIASKLEEALADPGKLVKYLGLNDHAIYAMLQELYISDLAGAECEDKGFAREALEGLFIQRKPLWKQLKRISIDLRRASHVFSPRFGEAIIRKIIEEINQEVYAKLGGEKVQPGDINVIVEKIDIYPSAGAELVNYLAVIEVKDGKVLEVAKKGLEEFAREAGLIPEALFNIYIARSKYKRLSDTDIKFISEKSAEIINDAIKGYMREAPETS